MSEPQSHWEWLAGGVAGLVGAFAVLRRALGIEWPKERIESRNEYREKVDRMQEDISKIATAIAPIGPALDNLAKAVQRMTEVVERLEDRSLEHQDKVVDAMQRLSGRVGDMGAQVEGLRVAAGKN